MILYYWLIKKGNTFNEFVDTYHVNINFVECYGIINALSNKSLISVSINLSSDKLETTSFQNVINSPSSTSKACLIK
jgi:hypothetical protein